MATRHKTLLAFFSISKRFKPTMQLREALTSATERLTRSGVGNSRKDAELLLMFVIGRDRTYLYAHPEYSLTREESTQYDNALVKRSQGMPPQYITGRQEFWGMDFVVSPVVLIPRPETEHLVETVLELARTMERPRIVDVGTGSGCIALALAKELPSAEVHAVDVSPATLDVARANAKRHELEKRVVFHSDDLLEGFSREEPFDFVVSNPPYIAESEKDQLQIEVREFEPHLALFSGPSGCEIIERLIQQSQKVLKPSGWLVMEMAAGQQENTATLLAGWNGVRFVKDLRGIARVVVATRG